jgi:hypothetical protein
MVRGALTKDGGCACGVLSGQLNIFLAILIEGYMAVKKSSDDSEGLPEELAGLLYHEARRLTNFFSGVENFISDDRLARELELHLQTSSVSLNRALKDYASIALGSCVQALALLAHTLVSLQSQGSYGGAIVEARGEQFF